MIVGHNLQKKKKKGVARNIYLLEWTCVHVHYSVIFPSGICRSGMLVSFTFNSCIISNTNPAAI